MTRFRLNLLHGYLRTMITIIIGVVSSLLAYAFTTRIFTGILAFFAFSTLLFLIALLFASFIDKFLFFFRLHHYGVSNLYPNQTATAERVTDLLRVVKTVDILGVRGLGIFALTGSLLHNGLVKRRGQIKIRILLLNPSSRYVRSRAEELGEDVESLRSGILMAADTVRELQNVGVDVAFRLYDAEPVWRMLALDQTLFISAFTVGTEGHEFPVLELTYNHPLALHSAFSKYFNSLWECSVSQNLQPLSYSASQAAQAATAAKRDIKKRKT